MKIFRVILSLIFLYTPYAWSQSDKQKDEDHIIYTSELFKCSKGQVVGINNLIKNGPWGIVVSEDSASKKFRLVSGTKVTLDEAKRTISWKDSNSAYIIQFDEKNEEIIQLQTIQNTGARDTQVCRHFNQRK